MHAPTSRPPLEPPLIAMRAGPRPARGGEPPGAVAEVVEDPLLVGEHPRPVPRAPVLSPAPQDRHRDDAAALDEGGPADAELRRHADVEAAVAVEEDGNVAVRLDVAPARQEQRHPRAVVGGHEHLLAHERPWIDPRGRRPEQPRVAALEIVLPQRARVGEGGHGEVQLGAVRAALETGGAVLREQRGDERERGRRARARRRSRRPPASSRRPPGGGRRAGRRSGRRRAAAPPTRESPPASGRVRGCSRSTATIRPRSAPSSVRR